MPEPLNPILLARLKQVFRRVRVSNPGCHMIAGYQRDLRTGRLRMEIVDWGEGYYVDCPFCGDGRQRLALNHRWGVRDSRTNDDNLHLCRCFNENCLSTRERQKQLHTMVFPDGVWGGRIHDFELPQAKLSAPEPPPVIVMPPGVPLDDLPPEHPAKLYLERRRFSPRLLARAYGVLYVESCESCRPKLYDRIAFPIYQPASLKLEDPGQVINNRSNSDIPETSHNPGENILSGWQARIVGDLPFVRGPKYLSAEGMQKSQLLYGLTTAIQTSGPVVLCEGPSDKWRIGRPAVALLGKSISGAQVELILRHFRGRAIAIWMDDDAEDEAEEIRQILSGTRVSVSDAGRVVTAYSPLRKKDPGECTPDEIRHVVRRALSAPRKPA
ncbi:MAG: hypothetical protein ABSB74_03835 [Tepidisphaeraceae bacterium]